MSTPIIPPLPLSTLPMSSDSSSSSSSSLSKPSTSKWSSRTYIPSSSSSSSSTPMSIDDSSTSKENIAPHPLSFRSSRYSIQTESSILRSGKVLQPSPVKGKRPISNLNSTVNLSSLSSSSDPIDSKKRMKPTPTSLSTPRSRPSLLPSTRVSIHSIASDISLVKSQLQAKISLLEENTMELLKEREKNREKDVVVNGLKNEIGEMKSILAEREKDILRLEGENQHTQLELSSYKSQFYEYKSLCESYQNKLSDSENCRKILHNQIMELKGNIRVFVRIKPMGVNTQNNQNNYSVSDGDTNMSTNMSMSMSMNSSMLMDHSTSFNTSQYLSTSQSSSSPSSSPFIPIDPHSPILLPPSTHSTPIPSLHFLSPLTTNLDGTSKSLTDRKKFLFSYDKILPPQATQSECFDEVQSLVQSAMDGYKVSVFAYGQTSSGKSYTMSGEGEYKDNEENDKEGVVPRSIRYLMKVAEEAKLRGITYHFTLSVVEIYNENIKCLLSNKDHCEIKYQQIGNQNTLLPYVPSALIVNDLSTLPDFLYQFRIANRSRSVAATTMNDKSSRSHVLYQIGIKGEKAGNTKNPILGVLNFIDLAGSERMSKLQYDSNKQQKETVAINKSLSSLMDVIIALQQRTGGNGHIPYRNSTLTHLLQSSFGGESAKTLFIINVNGEEENSQETLWSLRFGGKLMQCHVGGGAGGKTTGGIGEVVGEGNGKKENGNSSISSGMKKDVGGVKGKK